MEPPSKSRRIDSDEITEIGPMDASGANTRSKTDNLAGPSDAAIKDVGTAELLGWPPQLLGELPQWQGTIP
jgi:hypothetical protein